MIRQFFFTLLFCFGITYTHAQELSNPSKALVPNQLVQSWKKAGAEINYRSERCFSLLELTTDFTMIGEKHYKIKANAITKAIQLLPVVSDSQQLVLRLPVGRIEVELDSVDKFSGISFTKDNMTLRGDSTVLSFRRPPSTLSVANSKSLLLISGRKRVGIECLKIDANQYIDLKKDDDKTAKALLASYNIQFQKSEHCWAKNIVIEMGLGAHIGLEWSKHITIHGCTLSDAWTHGCSAGGQQGYGVLFSNSTSCLIENNIILKCRHAINLQYYSDYNVLAYNYLSESYALEPIPVIGVLTTWKTHNLVVHGFNPKNNLIEGNYTQDTDNGIDLAIGTTGGINVDNVKDEGNGENYLYRNYCTASMRVQAKPAVKDYNKKQVLIANTASVKLAVDADSVLLSGNTTNSLIVNGKDCLVQPYDSKEIGQSCYLKSLPLWLKSYSVGEYEGGIKELPAKDKWLSQKALSIPQCQSCNDTLKTEIREIEGIEISIFPNPVIESQLNIHAKQVAFTKGEIQVFDINMQSLKQYFLQENDISIDVSEWKSGIYFLQFRFGKYSVWKKVVRI